MPLVDPIILNLALLVAVAAAMLRNGAEAKFVQDWVDGELERMRRVGSPP